MINRIVENNHCQYQNENYQHQQSINRNYIILEICLIKEGTTFVDKR